MYVLFYIYDTTRVRRYNFLLLLLAQQLPVAQGLLIYEVFYITLNDALQSVGLLWTSDRLVAETST